MMISLRNLVGGKLAKNHILLNTCTYIRIILSHLKLNFENNSLTHLKHE